MSRRDADAELTPNHDTEVRAGILGSATDAGAGVGFRSLVPWGRLSGLLRGRSAVGGQAQVVQRTAENLNREDNRFRWAHENAGATRPYEEVRHGYQLG
jgi:hypothetical protein